MQAGDLRIGRPVHGDLAKGISTDSDEVSDDLAHPGPTRRAVHSNPEPHLTS
jgi:hypothetical protein